MILQSRRVWILNDWLEAQIEISAATGRIEGIYPRGTKVMCADDEDLGDLRIVPGFIDVHTHGAYGFDTTDADEEGLRHWLKEVVSEGVTGILPTTVTQSEEVLTEALRNVAQVARKQQAQNTALRDVAKVGRRQEGDRAARRQQGVHRPGEVHREPSAAGQQTAGEEVPGARILGIHLEGPCLDRDYAGAQPEQYCVAPNLEQFKRYLAASNGLIRIVTLACEHDEGYRLTRFLNENKIVPSLGHSSATFAQAAMAFANGARSVTHVYNGMAPFHHREPGIPGASFCYRNVYGEIICDGLHSGWAAVNAFFTNKGPDYGIMITDSLKVKGLAAGTKAVFGGNLIELCEDGSARLADGGKLAGSTLKMNEGLRNLVEKAGVPWQTAINSCTVNPARLIGMERTKGSIQTGKDADIVVLRDNYSVEAVFAGGKRYF